MPEFDRRFLASMSRGDLRRAHAVLRMQDAHPNESNPAAAQYDGLATTGSIHAEYRRRGWKIPWLPSVTRKVTQLTAREADWLCCVLETFTNTQDRKADERIRQSAWTKLRKIRDSKESNHG